MNMYLRILYVCVCVCVCCIFIHTYIAYASHLTYVNHVIVGACGRRNKLAFSENVACKALPNHQA